MKPSSLFLQNLKFVGKSVDCEKILEKNQVIVPLYLELTFIQARDIIFFEKKACLRVI